MNIEQIKANLPKNMHEIDRKEYLRLHKRIIEIETTGYNKHELEPLRNSAFNIINPYILDSNYKG